MLFPQKVISGGRWLSVSVVIGLGLGLAACQDEENEFSLEVTVQNATPNQPLSPVAMILHQAGYNPWVIGEASSLGLEMIAEGGDNTMFAEEASANPATDQVVADSAVVLPGGNKTLTISGLQRDGLQLSLATMLVRTNDGFTGLDAVSVGQLAVGEQLRLPTVAYESGTESNSETLATLIETGEGFAAPRDDSDMVTLHQGVVTADDGFPGSELNASHRFDNPVAWVTIKRTR